MTINRRSPLLSPCVLFLIGIAFLFAHQVSAVIDATINASDDSGGVSYSTRWSGYGSTRFPNISTTANFVTFENIMSSPNPDAADYFCESNSATAAPGWTTATVPNFTTQCTLDPLRPQFSLFNRTINDNTNYDFSFAIDSGGASPNNAIYLGVSARVDTLPPGTITVNETPVTGGSWRVNPGFRSGTPITVYPAPSPIGTNYTLISNTIPSGCSSVQSITNSDGGGSAMIVGSAQYAPQSKFFTITYNCPPSPPAPPTNVTATSGSCGTGQITISWTASSGATSYNVLRSTSSGGPYSLIQSGITGTSYTNSGLTVGVTYYYVVQAVNATGTSGNSNQASATAPSACAVPSSPTNVTATPGSCGTASITVSWTASSGATSYNVLRSTTSGGPYSQIASGVTGTSYTDPGLTAGVTYYYVVQAVNSNGTSGNSSQASATAPAACVIPSPPTNVTATPGSCGTGQITVSWTASSGATSYNVLRSATSGGPYSLIQSVAGTSYVNSGLTAGVTYYYVVQAANSNGTSGNSSQASATAPSACPTADLTGRLAGSGSYVQGPISISSGSFIDLSWTSTNATTCTASNGWSGAKTTSGTQTSIGPVNANTTYTLTCSGTGGSSPPDNFSVTLLSSATINVVESGASGGTWNITPGNYTGVSNSVNPSAGGTSYTIAVNTVPGGYTVSSITNTDGSGSSMPLFPGNVKQFTINYAPVASFDYSMSATNPPAVTPGQSTQSSVTKTLTNGTSQTVFLNALGLPSGITVSYDGQRDCSPTCSTTVTFNVGVGVSPGSYGVTLEGTATGGPTRTVPVTITVNSPPTVDISVIVTPSPGKIGQPVLWDSTIVGGTNCTYSWSGTDIPTSPPPSVDDYSITYQTTGTKTARVDVTCDEGSDFATGSVVVSVDPRFKEF